MQIVVAIIVMPVAMVIANVKYKYVKMLLI